MSDERQYGDDYAAPRRLRKSRLLHSERSRGIDAESGDLPFFLVNRGLQAAISDEPAPANSRFRLPPLALLTGLRSAMTPHCLDAREKLNSLWRRSGSLPHLVWRETTSWQAGRTALIAALLPLVLLVTFGRAPQTEKKAAPISATLQTLPPTFELEKRLAFARPLSDRLLSQAIEQSFEKPDVSREHAKADDGAAEPIELDADAMPPLQDSAEDQNFSLPFDSRSYTPTKLPKTSQDSFVAELGMSDLMKARTERPYVAENDAPPVSAPPKPKARKVAARKKVLAQKKKPAQVNQMTAQASPPAAVPQQPNLPPPPILFFLGAPPPPPQPAGQ